MLIRNLAVIFSAAIVCLGSAAYAGPDSAGEKFGNTALAEPNLECGAPSVNELSTEASEAGSTASPPVELASPPAGCTYSRTQTACYWPTKWCDELYICEGGREWWRGWEICGTCF